MPFGLIQEAGAAMGSQETGEVCGEDGGSKRMLEALRPSPQGRKFHFCPSLGLYPTWSPLPVWVPVSLSNERQVVTSSIYGLIPTATCPGSPKPWCPFPYRPEQGRQVMWISDVLGSRHLL